MAKNAWTDYSTTTASNSDIGGIAILGTNNISNFDNGLRTFMTHAAKVMDGTSPMSDGLKIGYASDLTANIQFDCAAITTATTRTVTMPDGDVTLVAGTMITTTSTSTLTNKSLSDSTTYFVDNADNTKILQFQCSGITTSTTRTVTWPDADITIPAAVGTSSIEFIIDGGDAVITTGIKGDIEVPFACTVTQATVLADQSGSIVIDIWKDTYANYPPTVADTITASAKPTLSTATKAQDSTLTGWTTSFAAGDVLRFNVDSASTVTRVLVSLTVTKS